MTSQQTDKTLAGGFDRPDLAQWRELVEKALKGADFEKRLVSQTDDGVTIQPLYTRADALAKSENELPGAAPLTRGTHPTRMGLGWDIRTVHVESDPKLLNEAILEDLNGGVTSLALLVGGQSLAITKDAMATALKDVQLDVCPIHLVAGAQFFDAAATLNAIWQDAGIAPNARLGSFGADPIGTLAVSGRLLTPIDESLARAVALLKLAEEAPHVTALLADSVPYHTAGASEAQELACMLATFVAYIQAADDAGFSASDAIPKIAVSLAADADEFTTIAKLRAARKLLWRVADACEAGEAASNIQFTAPTSYRMMAKRDPWTNILRTTIACAGAAIGGADSIVVLPFTYALGKPDAFAKRMARNVQIVCQEESNLGRVNDPAGGSWYVEQLTQDLAQVAWEKFQQIEKQGGILQALQNGEIQRDIAHVADQRANDIAIDKASITGVSAFPLLGDDGVEVEPWPASSGGREVDPAFGVEPLGVRRLGAEFEALRDAADEAGGYTIFVASMGRIVDHNVLTTWVKNYLAAGGIQTLISDGYQTAEEAAGAFKNSGAKAVCIASSDAVYAELAEKTARQLKAAGADLVLIAGKPAADQAEGFSAAGIDGHLAAGNHAVDVLADLHSKLVPDTA